MTPEQLHAWLNRPPPRSTDDREWEEFELLRMHCVGDDHQWAEERRGAPVAEFKVCASCGKIGERL